ncbi:MAG: MFS transporter [Nitrolancea sp.]
MSLRERFLVLILAIGGFAATVNAVILVPTLQPIADQFDTTDAVSGQIGTINAVLSGLTALIAAQWIDRFSRRRLLRIGAVIIVTGNMISALAPALSWLFVGRGLTGVGGALILPTCIAAAGDLFEDPVKRNRAVSTVWAATSLTLLVGLPILTQITALASWRWTMASALVPFGILLAGTNWLPTHIPGGSDETGQTTGLRAVFEYRPAVLLLVGISMFWVVFFGAYTYWGAFADTRFHVTANQLSLLLLVGGAADLVGTYAAPLAISWRSPRYMLITCATAFGLNLLAVGVLYITYGSLFLYMLIFGVSSGALVVYASILLLDTLPAVRGAMMSLSAAGNSLGGAAGIALAGVLLAVMGYDAIYVGLGLIMPLMIVCLAVSFSISRSAAAQEIELADGLTSDG